MYRISKCDSKLTPSNIFPFNLFLQLISFNNGLQNVALSDTSVCLVTVFIQCAQPVFTLQKEHGRTNL